MLYAILVLFSCYVSAIDVVHECKTASCQPTSAVWMTNYANVAVQVSIGYNLYRNSQFLFNVAIRAEQANTCRLLLDEGCEIHENNSEAMMNAINSLSLPMTKLLADYGGNAYCHEARELLVAISNECEHLLQHFLRDGSNLHDLPVSGYELAKCCNSLKIVEIIYEQGGSPYRKGIFDSYASDYLGNSSVEIFDFFLDKDAAAHSANGSMIKKAARKEYGACLVSLLRYGANPYVLNHNFSTLLSLSPRKQNQIGVEALLKEGFLVHSSSTEDYLRKAAKRGSLALMKMFFKYGASPYITTGNSLLQCAGCNDDGLSCSYCLQYLIDIAGLPMREAAQGRLFVTIDTLIFNDMRHLRLDDGSSGDTTNAPDRRNRAHSVLETLLLRGHISGTRNIYTLAARCENLTVLELLFMWGFYPSLNNQKLSLLEIGSISVFSMLLQHGLLALILDDPQVFLHLCKHNRHLHVKLLLDHGLASVHTNNNQPLHIAIELGSFELVHVLMAYGATLPENILPSSFSRPEVVAFISDMLGIENNFIFRPAQYLSTHEKCIICLDELSDHGGDCMRHSVSKGSFHAFHSSCIANWLKRHSNCPVCRQPVFKVAES